MHIFWHNDGVSLRPDNEQEHKALVLLFENTKAGWPTALSSSESSEVAQPLHLGVRDEQPLG